MLAVTPEQARSYYMTALAGLRLVEARRATGRRFGADADARWASLRGDLATADRIDLLIRDADAEWPGAFGARVVFAEPAVAEDDAFGPAWSPLPTVEADEIWLAALNEPSSAEPDPLFRVWSRVWGESLAPFEMKRPSPTDRFLVAGPSAIAATIRMFFGREDLAWSEQVTVVATPPSHRQLAALGGAILNTTRPPALYTSQQPFPAGGIVHVSKDAADEDAAFVRGGSD
jgi:hypothetical protein